RTCIDARITVEHEGGSIAAYHLLHCALAARQSHGGGVASARLESRHLRRSERYTHHTQQCAISLEIHHAAVHCDRQMQSRIEVRLALGELDCKPYLVPLLLHDDVALFSLGIRHAGAEARDLLSVGGASVEQPHVARDEEEKHDRNDLQECRVSFPESLPTFTPSVAAT